MDEPESVALSGEIVKRPAEVAVTPPAADIRYTDDEAVAFVFVRVEYADGRIREYQAKEPQDFRINNPEDAPSMAFGRGMSATREVRLSFRPNPRWNLHIRTEATAPEDFEGISYRLPAPGRQTQKSLAAGPTAGV
jgi:hypothetical protein